MRTLVLILASTAAGMAASGAPQEEAPGIVIPLTGLKAACCEEPVRRSLDAIEGVESVLVCKRGGTYYACVVMREGFGLPLSDVDRALGEATAAMGARMGTKYLVSDTLALGYVHSFRTATEPDEGALSRALSKLPGFRSVRVHEGGFGIVFEGKTLPTVAEVRKASGAEVTGVVLAPIRGSSRWSCPMHPERVWHEAAECPDCGMEMTEHPATPAPPPLPLPKEEAPKGG